MKANRKFVTGEEAVSPVIAVILMVAITVVLAATVFVLVSDIGGQQNVAPAFNMAKQETTDRLEVQSSAEGADWNRLEIRPTNTAIEFALNEAVATATTTTTAGEGDFTAVTGTPNPMGAGEFLSMCAVGAETNDVVIDLRDVQANQNMGTWTFQSLAACL